jgi:uncharacterized delta-60 repeat protein
VLTPMSSSGTEDYAIALQSDGKYVCVGEDNTVSYPRFAVAKYTANGTLDNTFGTGGIVYTNIGGASSAQSVTIQPDNKIVVSGTAGVGNANFAVARYNSNGSLDLSFGTGGIATTDFGGSATDYGQSVLLQPDAKILVAGYSEKAGYFHLSLARYNPDIVMGIEEEGSAAETAFAIYPNPAHDMLNIECKMENAGLKIYEVTGREIYSVKIVNRNTQIINERFSPGIYFVKVADGDKVYTEKLVIE